MTPGVAAKLDVIDEKLANGETPNVVYNLRHH